MLTVSHMPYLKQRHIYRVYAALALSRNKSPLTFRGWLDLPF